MSCARLRIVGRVWERGRDGLKNGGVEKEIDSLDSCCRDTSKYHGDTEVTVVQGRYSSR